MPDPLDYKYMKIALSLARRGVGIVAPNPSVGCVIVKDGQIIATGITGVGGFPHAEQVALKKIGKQAKGATVYVTLEPCCHIGKTPPCTDALIKAGVLRAVVALKDPFDKVSGRGISHLEKAGIEVVLGICEKEAREVNEGFLTVQSKGRPFVTLKLATSLDGKIATSTGKSKWITGRHARDFAHYLRAQNDAIMVGMGTVIADDPQLTCRLDGLGQQSPIRIVVGSSLSILKKSKLIKGIKEHPLWVVTLDNKGADEPLEKLGVNIIHCKKGRVSGVDLEDALQALAKQGITRVLVEGGSKLAALLINNNLVDKFVWIKAPMIIGDDGIGAIGDLKMSSLVDQFNFSHLSTRVLEDDVAELYTKM